MRYGQKFQSQGSRFGITRLCRVMPKCDLRDGSFCPYWTTMIDTFSCIYLFIPLILTEKLTLRKMIQILSWHCPVSLDRPWYKTEISRTDENRGKPCRVYKIQLILYSHALSPELYCVFREKCMSHDMTKPKKRLCAQQRLRTAWASAQSDQSLRCPHEETLGP